MRKIILFTLFFILVSYTYSQVPGNLSFQAVIRNASNVLVVSSPVGIRISLLQGSSSGNAVYVETHTSTTNPNGLITLEIGGGKAVSGDFKNINWGLGNYFIKVETDPAGGTNYSITSTTQVLSVPYALYAKKSADVDSLSQKLKALDSAYNNSNFGGKNTIYISNDITDDEAKAKIAKEWGPYTEQIVVTRCTNLKKLDLSKLSSLIQLDVTYNDILEEIDLSNLVLVEGDIRIRDCPKLKIIKVDKIEKIQTLGDANGIEIQRTGINELSFRNLKTLEGAVYLSDNDSLKSVDLSNTVGGKFAYIEFYDNNMLSTINLNNFQNGQVNIRSELLESLSLPKLKTVDKNQYMSISSPILKTISLPELTTLNGFSIYSKVIKEITLPKLTSVTSDLLFSRLDSLKELNFPVLKMITGYSRIEYNPELKSILFPELVSVRNLEITNNIKNDNLILSKLTFIDDALIISKSDSLISLNLSNLKSANRLSIQNNFNLSSLTIDALGQYSYSSLPLSNNKFTSTTINNLLSRFVQIFPKVSATVIKRFIELRQRISAPPTGQGLIDKQTLITNGHSINTN